MQLPSVRLEGAAGSHIALRPRNEDAVRALPASGLVVLADGMGGHPGGQLASELAVRTLTDVLGPRTPPANPERRAQFIGAALVRANMALRRRAPRDPQRPMATTALVFWCAAHHAAFGHVGDSRLYRLRDGLCAPLTLDHNAFGETLRAGLEPPAGPPSHLLSRALGLRETVRPDVGWCTLRPGDRYLLCTDGLSDVLSEDDLAAILADATSPAEAVQELVETALLEGGADNITAVVLEVHPR
ncbi:MAG: serine/threonine-protein phosphatase [Myxococcales bacterium]|nr:serine/threonine-protein phosphatase [Myxococcales bacterium]